MLPNFDYQPDEAEKLMISMFRRMFEVQFYKNLQIFAKDIAAELDTTYEVQFFNEEIKYYVPADERAKENLVLLLALVRRKDQSLQRILLKFYYIGDTRFVVGKAWLPPESHPLSRPENQN